MHFRLCKEWKCKAQSGLLQIVHVCICTTLEGGGGGSLIIIDWRITKQSKEKMKYEKTCWLYPSRISGVTAMSISRNHGIVIYRI